MVYTGSITDMDSGVNIASIRPRSIGCSQHYGQGPRSIYDRNLRMHRWVYTGSVIDTEEVVHIVSIICIERLICVASIIMMARGVYCHWQGHMAYILAPLKRPLISIRLCSDLRRMSSYKSVL